MSGEIKYYVNGHTAEGFVNFLSSNLVGINRTIVLDHPSSKLKTAILKKVVNFYQENYVVEQISSPQSIEYIDGIIIRELAVAILSKTDDLAPIEGSIIIDLMHNVLEGDNSKTTTLYDEAYTHFKKGLTIHDDLEKVYINEMDFTKADKEAENFIATMFKDVKKKKRKSIIYERLFGTNTPDGVLNHVENLIDPIKHRVFIKGRAGTGKSVFMRRVLETCKKYGFDVELYRCSFDPNSIDMLIIRDLNYCLFDSTAPHEFFPTRKSDVVIDLYEKTVTKGTDEKYEQKLNDLTKKYKKEMRAGLKKLQQTKEIHLLKEQLFIHLDKKVADETFDEIMNMT